MNSNEAFLELQINSIKDFIDLAFEHNLDDEQMFSIDNMIKRNLYHIKSYLGKKDSTKHDHPKDWYIFNFYQPYELNETIKYLRQAKYLFSEKFPNKKQLKLLDVGSGLGNVLAIGDKMKFDVTGIELSNRLSDFSEKLLPKATIIKEDILKFENYDNYDIIWCFNPCNGGESKVILEQIKSPTVFIYLNTDISHISLYSRWTKIRNKNIIYNF